jgi:hypothetical protein
MTETPFLHAWFEIMDSDTPERVLDLITDDFEMSIQFSKGEGQSAEFLGDRAGLVAYLEQREKSVLVHHITEGARVGDVEFLYGKVTDGGVTTGRVLSGVRLGDDGLIASYEVTFDTEHVLVED